MLKEDQVPDAVTATRTIDQKLDTTGWFNTVTHDEVRAAADTLGDRTLSAADTRKTIDSLAASGNLDKFAREAVDGSILGLGGLSVTERRQFFASMAGKLDGASLAKLSDAFARTDGNSGGREYVEELGKAIAAHASPSAKLEYVQAQAAKTTDKPSYFTSYIGGSMSHAGDAEAAAVADVIGSMRGPQARAAFDALKPDQFKAVVGAGVTSTSSYSEGGSVTSYEASRFEGLSRAAASVDDSKFKARVFAEGTNVLRDVREAAQLPGSLFAVGGKQATATVRDGLTRILDSDVSGVMKSMTYGRSTLDGSAMAAYSKAMLNGGQEKKLGEFMSKLALGNNGTDNAIARMNQVETAADGTDRRVNAGAMGYFVGSVYKAAESITSDVKAQQEFANAVLKSALTVIDKTQPWGRPVGIAASVAKEWTIYAVRAAIEDPGQSAAIKLEKAALPIDPKTDTLGVGDAASTAFGDVVDRVRRQARP